MPIYITKGTILKNKEKQYNMGMAASQVRFLQLTSRKHDIGLQLEHLSLQRMALTRDVNKLSLDYNRALSSKVMKWSTNAGVTSTDLSYSTLMRPSSANNYKPALLTDSSDRVVVDSKYKKFAEMISPDGSPGGTWNGSDGEPRTSILAKLTGFSPDKINEYSETQKVSDDAHIARSKALDNLEKWLSKEPVRYVSADRFASKLGKFGNYDLSSLYYNGTIHISSAEELEALTDFIKDSLSQYFVDAKDTMNIEDNLLFQTACDSSKAAVGTLLNDYSEKGEERRKGAGITGETNNWEINFEAFFNGIMDSYAALGGSAELGSGDEFYFAMRDTTSGSSWDTWYKKYVELNNIYEESEKTFAAAKETNNEVFTGEEETLIDFYDKIFTAIVEKGWVEDYNVSDNDYLNQKLQNNDYYITEMSYNDDYDEYKGPCSGNYRFNYSTDIASNCDNIVMVSDQKIRDDAQADYEYKKQILSAKESKIDTMMKNYETEQSSIIKMLESIDKVKEDNTKRYFEIFS